MKKQFNGKLKFNKEVVSILDNSQLSNINGGLNIDASRIRCTGDLATCKPCQDTGTMVCPSDLRTLGC